MSEQTKSVQDVKLDNSIKSHPKFSKVIELMKGESVSTAERILFEVISSCRASSKVI